VREYFNDLTGPLWENIGQCTCLLAAPSTLSIPKIKKIKKIQHLAFMT
jgi:hypothetical protein